MAAGTLVAAAALAAITALGPSTEAPSSSSRAVNERLQGVHEDLARAVALRQVSAEQAQVFERQLLRRIQASSSA